MEMLELFDWSEWADASFAIKLHMIVAILGFVVGTLVMIAHRGTVLHRWMGRGFAGAALITALSSFFIHEINQWGQWSWIHLISIYVLYATIYGVLAIRRGDVKGHMGAMIPVYLGGFVVAGAFTLLPGRMMFETFLMPSFAWAFPSDKSMGELVAWVFPIIGASVAIWLYRRNLVGPLKRG